MKSHKIIAFALLALLAITRSSQADVKNVWVGVNGATCPT